MANNESSVDENDEYEFKPKKSYELEKWADKNMEDFSSLLEKLEDIDIKQKTLWKQIYENAVTDRKNAYLAWTDLYIFVHSNEDNHFKHGTTLAKYMERMEKANEQILKLATLVEKAKMRNDEENMPSADEIFTRSERKFTAKS